MTRLRLGVSCLATAVALGGCSALAPTPRASPTATRTPVRLGPTSTTAPTTPTAPPLPPAPTPLPLPEVSASDWILGPDDAPATLLIYADFQSPGSRNALKTAFQVAEGHPDSFRLVFRHLPMIPSFDKDSLAGQAVEAAGAQDGFWPMTRALVDRYEEWTVLPPEDFQVWVVDLASGLGLDAAALQADLDNGRYAAFMLASYQDAQASGLPGPPVMFFNSLLFRVPPTLANLEAAVRLEIVAAMAYSAAPELDLRQGSDYFATLILDEGEVVIQLLPEAAPAAVNSFVFLARQDWFDGTEIFRVVPEGWVEAGDPSGTGLGDAGYHLPDEIDPGQTFDQPGMVALASVGPNTGGSRFLITLAPVPVWNGTRTIFGRVIQGLEILQGLERRDPVEDMLKPGAAVIREVVVEVVS